MLGQRALMAAAGAFRIEYALQFPGTAGNRLQRDHASTGDNTKFTFACYAKIASSGGNLLESYKKTTPNTAGHVYLPTTGTFSQFSYDSDTETYISRLSGSSLSLSTWYALAAVVDTGQATAADRVKLYVDGTQISLTEFNTQPSQSASLLMAHSGTNYRQYIGEDATTDAKHLDAIVAEIYYLDGITVDPATAFGHGVQPKRYTGSFGTLGYYLNFTDDNDLGTDFSGNGNDWTAVGVTVGSNRVTDTPTNPA